MSGDDRKHPGLNLGNTDRAAHDEAEPIIFGFWIFLMSDLVLFALLFATYASMSVTGVADGPGPAELFDLRNPFIETMILLASSLTFGMASLALKHDKSLRGVVGWMLLTGLLGAAFVGMEVYDFYTMIVQDAAPPQLSGFLSSFYLLVGTHGVHVTAGLIWMVVLLIQVGIFGMSRDVKLRIMRLALFWHMLDIVWIGIFTFVYLFGVVA